jgi:hypothetical protein
MLSRVSGRLPRVAVGAAALLAGAGILTVPAMAVQNSAAQGSLSTTRVAGFATAPGTVRLGGALWDEATVLPRGARAVTVQYRRQGSGHFTDATRLRSSASGAVQVALQPPSAGTWQFRVAVASTSRATGFVSKTRTVTASGRAAVTGLSGLALAATTVPVGDAVSDDVVVAPRGARRVLVQGRAPGAARFVTLSTETTSSSGAFRAQYRPTTVGTWAFRLVLPASATARSFTSPARTVTATARDNGPASTGGAAGSGAPTPGNPTGGSTTPGGPPPGGPTPGNGDPTPGGGTTTPPAATTAALAVRLPGYPDASPLTKVTVDVPFAFDASASVAADGGTLVSGDIDYGDGQSDPLTGPNGPVDYWNTLHTYTSTGRRTVTLTVTDADGTKNATSVDIVVYDAPTAALRVTSGPAQVGQKVTIALDTVTPPGTTLSSYFLIVNGAPQPGALSNAHFFVGDEHAVPATRDLILTTPGSYTVTMHVANDAGGVPVEAPSVSFEVAPQP